MIASINTARNRPRIILQFALIIIALLLLAWVFSDLLTYILISLIVVTILRPLVTYLRKIYIFKTQIPRSLAVMIALGAFVGVIFLFVQAFLPLISDQIDLIKNIKIDTFTAKITTPIDNFEHFLTEKLRIRKDKGFVVKEINRFFGGFLNRINIGDLINGIAGIAASTLVYVLAISFVSFFLLYEKGLFRKAIISSIPNRYFEITITAFYKIEQLLSNYLRAILIETFLVFSLYGGLGLILGVPYALTIAAFAASINFIPYLGPFSGLGFGILVLFTDSFTNTELDLSLIIIKFVSMFLTVRLFDDIFLQPFIFSKSVKAHPLEIFLVIFAGASLAGALGMVLAIPTYTVLKVTFIEVRKGFRTYRIFR